MNDTKTYCLPKLTTPEQMETRLMLNRGTVLTYGDHILATGYYYTRNGKNYYAALYTFTSGYHSCEDEISLTAIAPETFEDNGHAIAWAMSKANE